ncbi:hypothetical protein CS063_00090 [Sporanaerobium hydrogeniformans]|uniref:Uncharacterized protein n=1 Tax=Sporanaerobium hydrogeniformans TaxID=3072179 RepID=A0AC61DGW5_9FIRM|nr:phage tail spike protein [Sporanaerobium hydrogeniformans]PHV71916.1 hypothetical protein CS063_00090 [Sporanaerobium hydrogeniformans]
MLKIENVEGTVLAFLNNLTEAKAYEVLNGEYMLSFVATIDHLKTDYLYDNENLINYENDLFRVIKLEELHDEDNMITVAVTAEHISYDLINNVLNSFNYINKNCAEVMTHCLLGTGFNLRNCDITKKTDIQYKESCNSKQISIAIANNWQGELKYYRYYIDVLQNRGVNRGTGFIFGKNLKSVKRIRNFAEDTLSYEVEIVEGSEIDELGQYDLGDTIRVMDERLNIDYECKIVEIEKDILTGMNSRVVLGDAIKDMRSSFSSVKKQVDEVKEVIDINMADWDKIKEITNANGDIILGKLNALTGIASKIVNSTGTFEHRDNALYWQDQPTKEDSTFATLWSAKGIVFANNKDAQGEWIWESALDSEGIIANQVTASAINALSVNAIEVLCTKLTAQTIQGLTIEGGVIYSGDRTTGNYIEVSPNNPIKIWKNKKLVGELGYTNGDGTGGGRLALYSEGGTKNMEFSVTGEGNNKLFFNGGSNVIYDENVGGYVPSDTNAVTEVDGILKFSSSKRPQLDGNGDATQLCTRGEAQSFVNSAKANDSGSYYCVTSVADGHSHTYSSVPNHSHTVSTFSDIRLKENIEACTDEELLDALDILNVYRYNFINDKDECFGVIAQELLKNKLTAMLIEKDENGYYRVFYQGLGVLSIGINKILIKRMHEINNRLSKIERVSK